MKYRIALISGLVFFYLCQSIAFGGTLVSTSYNAGVYDPPLSFYRSGRYDVGIEKNSADALGPEGGFAFEWDHSISTNYEIGVLKDLQQYLERGVYFRYWVKYSNDYKFPGDIGAFENLKLFKVAGQIGYNIEFIYKNTAGGPKGLQLYWMTESSGGTQIGGTGTGEVSLGKTMEKGKWHKIEIYIKVASTSEIHVQIDDFDVYVNRNANIRVPATSYTGTQQFQSIRAGSVAPAGHGKWYTDNYTIVYNQDDLCDNEPIEPASVIMIPELKHVNIQ